MIEDHLQEIERLISRIRQELNPSFRLEPDGLRVTATFSGVENPDILYYNPSLHKPWRFRASAYIDIESGMSIKVDHPGEWKFRLVSEGQAVTEKALTLTEKSEPDKKDILFGFWDSYHVPDDAPQNVRKLDWSRLDNRGRLIPSIGGFEKDMPERDIRDRLKYRKDHIDSVGDQIEYILLHDEPFYKGFTPEKQEQILQIAKEEIPGYKFAFSYARGALRDQPDQDRRLPENLDVAMINNYTFHPEEYWPEMYITSQAEFEADLKRTVDIVRSQVPEIVLTGQAITQEGKYRQPPLESVRWNVETCYKFDLKGVIWFEYRNRSKWKGAESMPEFYDEMKAVFKRL